MRFQKLYNKYKDVIPYAVFGVLTTLVNIFVYWLSAHLAGIGTMPSTIIAWVVSVVFAYLTNRKWVFHSKTSQFREIITEFTSFVVCRLATGVIDWLCMFIFVDLIHFNDVFVKIAANIVVIILNYIASKLVIFKNKSEN